MTIGIWPKTNRRAPTGQTHEVIDGDMNDVLDGAYSALAAGMVPNVFTSLQASVNATKLAYGLQDAASKGKAFYLQPGTYFLPWTYVLGNRIPLPDNTVLIGRGYNTVFKLDASGLNTNGNARCLGFNGSNIILKGFRVDGDRANVNVGARTLLQTVFAQKMALGALDSILIEDVWAHGLAGTADQECFAFSFHHSESQSLITGALTNLVYRRCRGWNNAGTPFHANGTINSTTAANWNTTGSYMTDGVLIDDCECWSNDWMGVSVYGAKNVRVVNSRFYLNGANGLNTEWSEDVTFDHCWSHDNAHSGASIYGRTAGEIIIQNCKLDGNNTVGATTYGEITQLAGSWWTGVPPRGVAHNIQIRNNVVLPIAGRYHLRVQRDATVNVGEPICDSITIQQDDFASWTVGEVGSAFNRLHCNVRHQGGAPVIHQVNTGQQIGWTASNATVTAYGSTGNLNPGAININVTSHQFGNVKGKSALLPGRTYRIRARVKSADVNGEWYLAVHEGGAGSNQTFLASHLADASQVGVWHTVDVVTTIDPSWLACGVMVMRNDAGANSADFVVDYCNVEELASSVGMSEAPTWMGRLVGRGSAAPTTGTWSIGDIWLNDAPSSTGNIGWTCSVAGTPGTWLEFGHISTDTNQPTFANATLSGAAGSVRDVVFNTSSGGGSGGTHNGRRWVTRCSNDVESGGSNTGSKYQLNCYDDDGNFLFTSMEGSRDTGYMSFKRGTFKSANAITYSASMTPNSAASDIQTITVTNNTAFTINAPSNATTGQRLTFRMLNSIGGGTNTGAATWNAIFKLGSAWGVLADTKTRLIDFHFDGTSWLEIARSADL